MASLDYVIDWFFPQSNLNDHRVQGYYDKHWYPCGCQWLIQHSTSIARRVMEISIRQGHEVAIEALQIALNDISIGKCNLLDEDSVIGPKTIQRLKYILESIELVEERILRVLDDF